MDSILKYKIVWACAILVFIAMPVLFFVSSERSSCKCNNCPKDCIMECDEENGVCRLVDNCKCNPCECDGCVKR